MKSIKLATLVSVMALASGIASAHVRNHQVSPNAQTYQSYQEGANAPSARQQSTDNGEYRTINSDYGK